MTIPKSLKLLYINGYVVTTDAMGYQKDIIKMIVYKNSNYLLVLKWNQKLAYVMKKEYLDDAVETDFKNISYNYAITVNKRHARSKVQKYYITESID